MPSRSPVLSRTIRCAWTAVPQLPSLCQTATILSRESSRRTTFGPAWSSQYRLAHILASIRDNKGAYQKRIRLGRGASSDKGKTSGRGQKGQKARGSINPWFQGGQTPLKVRLGPVGERKGPPSNFTTLHLGQLQDFINSGRLDVQKRITFKELWDARIITHVRDGIELLAAGKERFHTPIDILVSRASPEAIQGIEDAGGRIITRYYTRRSLMNIAKGQSVSTDDKPLPVGPEHVEPVLEEYRRRVMEFAARGKQYRRLPDPADRKDIEYYRDPAHRGYMSHQVKAGESPSLFYKIPEAHKLKSVEEQKKDDIARKKGVVNEKRMW